MPRAGGGGRTWWGLRALVARGAANAGRKIQSVLRLCWSGDCRGGNKVDVLPAFMGLLVGGGSKGW